MPVVVPRALAALRDVQRIIEEGERRRSARERQRARQATSADAPRTTARAATTANSFPSVML
jgi:hypothetical protein